MRAFGAQGVAFPFLDRTGSGGYIRSPVEEGVITMSDGIEEYPCSERPT